LRLAQSSQRQLETHYIPKQVNDFAARDSSRLIGGSKMKKQLPMGLRNYMMGKKAKGAMTPGVKTMVPGPKHTFTKTKRLRGMPKMGTGGLTPRMKRNKGVSQAVDMHAKSSMRKHGIRL
jgi:hypothetical protein